MKKADYISDTDRVRALKDGDLCAFNELFDRYGKRLYRFPMGYLKSAVNNLKLLTDPQIIAKQFTDQITGLTPGTYYARVAVLATNSLNRYNYSQIVKVEVP